MTLLEQCFTSCSLSCLDIIKHLKILLNFIFMSLPANIDQYTRAAQAGEEMAWSVLYQHYYPQLYPVALRMLTSIDAAKDAVQDTFIKAHLKLPQLKDTAAFGGWIKTILIRTCYRSA